MGTVGVELGSKEGRAVGNPGVTVGISDGLSVGMEVIVGISVA